jgi:hypothetical protein
MLLSACVILALAGPAAEHDAGSAYLQTLAAADPPFGRLVGDGYPWDGVRVQRWRRDEPEADWLLVRLDLRTPGLGYRVTPVHYRAGPGGVPFQAVHAQTTAEFVRQTPEVPRVDLAVNTVAFWPFPVRDGTPVFLSEPVWTGSDMGRDPDPPVAMLGLLPGRALIGPANEVRAAGPVCAFGGFRDEGRLPEGVAVWDGQPRQMAAGERRGQTVAGVSRDGRILLLLMADGYNPGTSVGLDPAEAARVIRDGGADRAVFLDNGGSSTLVARDGERPVLLHRPAGVQMTPGTLRCVAANLGFTGLRRSADPLPILSGAEAPWLVALRAELVLYVRCHPWLTTVVGLTVSGGLVGVIGRRLARWRRLTVQTVP